MAREDGLVAAYQIPASMAQAIEDMLDQEHGMGHGLELFVNDVGAVAIVVGDDQYGEWPLNVEKVAEVAESLRSRGFEFESVGNTLIVRPPAQDLANGLLQQIVDD